MARWLGLAAAVWCAGSPVMAQDSATAAAPPVVFVSLEDPDGHFDDGGAGAQPIVAEVFRQAGVTVTWRAEDAPGADRALAVTIATAGALGSMPGSEAMGVAPSPGDGTRGTRAFVFADRVRTFAYQHGVPVAYVLACAVTHELGHLLLPPNAHAGGGVMRGEWHPRLFPPRAHGIQGFARDQARLLRLRSRRSVLPNKLR